MIRQTHIDFVALSALLAGAVGACWFAVGLLTITVGQGVSGLGYFVVALPFVTCAFGLRRRQSWSRWVLMGLAAVLPVHVLHKLITGSLSSSALPGISAWLDPLGFALIGASGFWMWSMNTAAARAEFKEHPQFRPLMTHSGYWAPLLAGLLILYMSDIQLPDSVTSAMPGWMPFALNRLVQVALGWGIILGVKQLRTAAIAYVGVHVIQIIRVAYGAVSSAAQGTVPGGSIALALISLGFCALVVWLLSRPLPDGLVTQSPAPQTA